MVPAPLSLQVSEDGYKTNAHMGDCRWKCSQHGNGMPAEPHGQGRRPELSSEGRERDSFLGRGIGPCKGQEVGKEARAGRGEGARSSKMRQTSG